MTREEAIKVLNTYDVNFDEYTAEEIADAIDMAIEALSAEHKHCWDCKHYEPKYNVCHAPEVVKQVTSKLKKPCDSLLTEESNGSKEQKSKLEHDREWIIGCIKHDGFIKTDRFDKANQIILEALQTEVVRCKDCRWWNSETKGCKRNPSVEAWYETDFCKYGERQCNYFGERREE